MIEIKMNKEKSRAEALDDGKVIGHLAYSIKDDVLDAYHTEVDKDYNDQGIAKELVDEISNFARNEDKKILPTCPYIVKKFDEDEEYKDVDAR